MIAAVTLLAKIDSNVTTECMRVEVETPFDRQKETLYQVIQRITLEEIDRIEAEQRGLEEGPRRAMN